MGAMGMFTQRPEDPTEWAGLPSEPLREETGAERLGAASPVVDALGLVGGGSIASISIPVVPAESSEPSDAA